MKTRLRTAGELQKMSNYLNDTYNVDGHQYVSLAFPPYARVVSLREALNLYFKERKWMRVKTETYWNPTLSKDVTFVDDYYRKFKGLEFLKYFELN